VDGEHGGAPEIVVIKARYVILLDANKSMRKAA